MGGDDACFSISRGSGATNQRLTLMQPTMTTLTPDSLLSQLQWRYATKKFDPTRSLPPATWETLEKALILTPSSFGVQPWRFVVVTSAEVRQKLVPASWGQTQPQDCSHYVVIATRRGMTATDVDRLIERTAEVRGIAKETLTGYRNVVLGTLKKATEEKWADEWAKWQGYIALGNLMTAAAALGVDTCPMEGLEPAKYDEILGLNGTGYGTAVACAVGYRAADDKYASLPKVRYPASEVILRR